MSETDDIRRTFREAIEAIRRDISALNKQIIEHIAVCNERHIEAVLQREERNKVIRELKEAGHALELRVQQTATRVLWWVVGVGATFTTIIVIAWIRLAGHFMPLSLP